ncbi:MAG: cell division protein FtsH [Micavibrio sp.]|nr:cell division protein FtsH [Micavibrio sp.]
MPQPPKKPQGLAQAAKLVVIFAVAAVGYNLWQNSQAQKSEAKTTDLNQMVPYTEMVDKAHKKQFKRIDVMPDGKLVAIAPGQPPVMAQGPTNDNLMQRFNGDGANKNVELNFIGQTKEASAAAAPSGGGGGFGISPLLMMLLPTALLIGFMYWMMKKQQGGGAGGVGGFGKSKARMLDPNTNDVSFDDVAGCDEAKEEVKEIVDFLKDPGKFKKLGGKIPKGALLVGPPGTGKTMLAKAVASSAKVPFFSISGSDFVEMYVGVGAARVRDMFENAKKNAPCIIFVDEIDAVGGRRGGGGDGGNSEREQTLNQMLVEMDGVGGESGVIVFAATNRPEILDPALLRPGRFDRQVYVTLPDIKGREQILRSYARKHPLSAEVDLRVVARGTPGMSGADLANLLNEAALMAGRRKASVIGPQDFDTAKDKIMMGTERRTAVMPEHELRNTAYHETGHMLMNKKLPQDLVDPFYKMTIMPRGRALGMSMSLPAEDRYSASRARMQAEMVLLMGGRAAEIKKFGWENVTGGASNDIERATEVARNMVMKYGMSEKLGPQRFVTGEGMSMLGGGASRMQPVSGDTMNLIDAEVKALIDEAEVAAMQILNENEADFERVSVALLHWETLTNAHVDAIFRGEDIDEIMKKEMQVARKDRLDNKKIELSAKLANDNKVDRPEPGRFDMK